MPIKVKHSPSAAALGQSAYTAGREERRRWEAEIAMRAGALDLQARGLELQAERGAGQLALQQEELGFRKDQDAANRAAAERRWNDEPARQLQMGLQQQELLQKNLEWQYDEGQKREMAKITTGIAWLRGQVAAGKWTPEQAEQAEQQLWQKYHSIIPLPVYDDKAKPQEMYDSRIVTDPITGARAMMDDKGNFQDVPGSLTFANYSKFYADTLKAMFKQDAERKDITDYEAVDKIVLGAITRFSQIQGLAAKAGEEQTRQPSAQEQIAAEQQQQEQEIKMQAAVEALPTLFKKLIEGQPRIYRIKKGKTSSDMVYGEEAYTRTLTEAVGRGKQEGIPPDVMKAELDKWWDAQYDKERGQMLQKFGNRMEFKVGVERYYGITARKVAPEKRTIAPEVERVKMKAPDGYIYEVDRSEVEEAKKHDWKMF